MASLNAVAGKKFLFSLRVVQQRLAQPRPWGHQQVGKFTAFDNLALFQQRRVVTDGFTTSNWCVISTMVRLRRWLISASRASTEAVVSGSSALVASSHSSTSGRAASARAMPTRCFCPPESCDGKQRPFR